MSDFNFKESKIINGFKALDAAGEKWSALRVQELFGYENEPDEFLGLIRNAREICEKKGIDPTQHFSGDLGDIDMLSLTKYSCFLISVFADLRKKNVTYAKTYFELEVKNMYI